MAIKKAKNSGKKNRGGIIILLIIAAAAAYFVIFMNNKKPKTKEDIPFIKKEEMIKFKKEGELTFRTADDKYIHKIDIEFAENDDQRADGLMNRFKMQETQGMLFVFETERKQSFWMRNTFISLDMIFVNSNYEIVTIHKNTEILNDNSYASIKPAQYVIETVAGFCDKYNINVGDKVVWRSM